MKPRISSSQPENRQLTLELEPGLSDTHRSLTEVCASVVYARGRSLKTIAADLDLAPGNLSKMLSDDGLPAPDRRKVGVDDMVRIMEITGDMRPLQWLAERFMAHQKANPADAIRAMQEQMQALTETMAKLGRTA
ncbi:MAG: hypothetical protein KGH75_05865 [Rhodospirillales bacterium]|nr:hypothetical protein [Rhodospirillales bacterium]